MGHLLPLPSSFLQERDILGPGSEVSSSRSIDHLSNRRYRQHAMVLTQDHTEAHPPLDF